MIERFLTGLAEKMEDPDDCVYMNVVIPGDLDPFDRHYRFSIHVDAELRLEDLGCSVGGGTLYYEPEEEGDPLEIACCILDVDATDVDGARALLRRNLPELGAPAGTLVQWGNREDRFDGAMWHLNEPRSIEE
ncbi:MAG TPA: hypothetical protein VFM42_04585 [Sphingomicrobium sp.]|jgi:hypothetical protein|nr:hypothetical protein [Sphingomicrobium sp.]